MMPWSIGSWPSSAPSSNASVIVASRSALIQRDGDVVDVDGSSPVAFPCSNGSYFVGLRHRNHLGMLTLQPLLFSADGVMTIDFTDPSLELNGIGAMKEIDGTRLQWAGDVRNSGQLKYSGSFNDRDAILQIIGGTIPTNTVTGYHQADVNCDGVVKYTGPANDRDLILLNIGGTIPTNTVLQQLPN